MIQSPRDPLSAAPSSEPWSLARRVVFRFLFVYFVLYTLPFPLDSLPLVGGVASGGVMWFWDHVVLWTGEHVLRLAEPITVRPNGSGDTTWNYVQLFCFAVISGVVTVAWSLIARRARHHAVLHDWLRAYLRFYLAATMISYGLAKVYTNQFAPLGTDRLLHTFGEASPMGLLWTFMAASPAYQMFGGWMEVIAGLPLFFRRTSTLGALLSIAVLTNVVMLNFCYDVPVKLYSTHLLLMAVFLALPDAERLLCVLVLNRPAMPANLSRPAAPAIFNAARAIGGVVLAIFLCGSMWLDEVEAVEEIHAMSSGLGLVGVYDVTEFRINGEPVPGDLSYPERWRRIGFGEFNLTIRRMDDSVIKARREEKPEESSFGMRIVGERAEPIPVKVSHPGEGLVTFELEMYGQKISATGKRLPDGQFVLTSRGFRWINERPFNR